jgi:hypothetical protein
VHLPASLPKPAPTDYGNTSDQDEFATALKLGGKLFNVLLEADDLFVWIRIS